MPATPPPEGWCHSNSELLGLSYQRYIEETMRAALQYISLFDGQPGRSAREALARVDYATQIERERRAADHA